MLSIIKASGKRENFDGDKLKKSLFRAGASEQQASEILSYIYSSAWDGMRSKDIYNMAFERLRQQSQPIAAKFSLKKAIMDLGPSGFPFEMFIAELFRYENFKAETGQFIQGKCIQHEVDIVVQNDEVFYLMECKYHNAQGIITGVKIPLYIHSRFRDIMEMNPSNKQAKAWIVTNTRFSQDAIMYAACSDIDLLGWDYPKKHSLKDRIDSSGLYPVTCLTSITHHEQKQLLDKRIVLCRSLLEQIHVLHEIGIKKDRAENIKHELQALCKPKNGKS